jgi:hypothetical protein
MLSGYRMTEKILGAGSLGTVIAGAAMLDETVRGYVTGVLAEPAAPIGAAIERGHRVAFSLMDTVGYHGGTHAPLVLFAVGAGGLVLLLTLTRT